MLDPLREAFYTRQMLNPLSCGQVALWHALVYVSEKAHKQEWFTVAGITLAQLSGLSTAGVKKARNELKQQGLINFRTNGTRATSYKMCDILKSSQDSSQDSSRDSSQDSSRNGSALKQHQHHNGGVVRAREAFQLLTDSEMDAVKSDYTTTTQKLYEAMEAVGMPMTQAARDRVEAMAAERGLDAVLDALSKAGQHDTKGGVSVAYLEKILSSGPKPEEAKPQPKMERYSTIVDGKRVYYEREAYS